MKLSIILPTYNNEKVIEDCLQSIFIQNFPKNDFEVLLIDGGSTDKTLEIAKKHPVKILENKKRIEEAARILGIKKAEGEILCFIDADNILTGTNWIERMLESFNDEEIIFADTLYYSCRKNDKISVRYQALIGGDDPIVTYLGFYSRWNYLKNDWTNYPYTQEDKGSYLKVRFKDKNKVPAMGCNGFMVRTKIARQFSNEQFIHSDFVYDLVNSGYNCFAKVKTGIIHNQPNFFRTKIRRMKRRKEGIDIAYNYGLSKRDFLATGIYIGLIIPVFFDSIKGFIRKRDFAWFFHIPASLILLILYIFNAFQLKFTFKNSN